MLQALHADHIQFIRECMSTVISICEPLWTDPIPSLKTGIKHRKYCVFKTDNVTLGHTLRETDGLFRVFKVYPVWTVACPIRSVACQSTSTQVQCIIYICFFSCNLQSTAVSKKGDSEQCSVPVSCCPTQWPTSAARFRRTSPKARYAICCSLSKKICSQHGSSFCA